MSSVFLTSILKYDRGQGPEINRDLCIQQWEETYKPGKMCWNLIKKCVETPETSHGGPLVVNRELCAFQWEDMFKPGKYTKRKMCKKVHGICVKKIFGQQCQCNGAGRRGGEKIGPRKVARKGEDSKCWCKNQNTAREKKTERAAENFMPYFHILWLR